MKHIIFEEMDGIVADVRDGDMSTLIVASQISAKFKIPLFYRRVPKDHGTKDEFEGGLDTLAKCKNVFTLSRWRSQ